MLPWKPEDKLLPGSCCPELLRDTECRPRALTLKGMCWLVGAGVSKSGQEYAGGEGPLWHRRVSHCLRCPYQSTSDRVLPVLPILCTTSCSCTPWEAICLALTHMQHWDGVLGSGLSSGCCGHLEMEPAKRRSLFLTLPLK